MSVPPGLAPEHDWQRLDPRMLLVHPVREVVKFLPVLLGVLVAGTATGTRLCSRTTRTCGMAPSAASVVSSA
mgnify:CR=1 FL=1